MNHLDISELRSLDLTEQIKWYADKATWYAEARRWLDCFPRGNMAGDRWFITQNEDGSPFRLYSGLIWHVLPRPELRSASPVMLARSTALALLEIDEQWGEVFLDLR